MFRYKKKNNSFNTSSTEEIIFNELIKVYPDVVRQYKDDKRYPYDCDFYIPSLDLFIEYQGSWTHGKDANKIIGPYIKENEFCQKILEKWKAKNTKYYNNAIETWTIRDVKKRQIAKKNKLKFLEFWTLDEFRLWLNKQ